MVTKSRLVQMGAHIYCQGQRCNRFCPIHYRMCRCMDIHVVMKAIKCITLGASGMCMMWPRMRACAYYYTDAYADKCMGVGGSIRKFSKDKPGEVYTCTCSSTLLPTLRGISGSA